MMMKKQYVDGNLQKAYDAGYDCANRGANDENCHFHYFSTPATTAAWERGKSDFEKGA